MALQEYSLLKNLMDRGAWQAMVHRVAQSDMTEAAQHAHRGLQFRKLYEVDIIKAGSTRMCSLKEQVDEGAHAPQGRKRKYKDTEV